MPLIEKEIEINAPLEKVFEIAQDVEEYPHFMPSIKSVRILEKEGDRRITEWVGRVEELGRTITWKEEDIWDKERGECRFRGFEGDFNKYEGVWIFQRKGEGTLVRLKIEYEMHIPLIGVLLQGLIKRKVEESARDMLEGLKERCELGEV
ncbi:SRPBCC family protein [bacterium]|nr:SRPBCC family protein [bacterium]